MRPLVICLAIFAFNLAPLAAQATPYVPELDPAYRDLDVLVAAGVVRDIIVGERPYSRAAFARFVAEAGRYAGAGRERGLPARLGEALDRLDRRFSPGPGGSAPPKKLRTSSARLVLTGSDSPYRLLRPGRGYDRIDGFVNPLLDRSQGRLLADGVTVSGEAVVDIHLGRIAAQVSPRLSVLSASNGQNGKGDATFVDAYARAVFGPVGIDVGRNHVSLGHGAERGPLLSQNARGLDLVRVSADRPVRFPGFLGAMGLWQASLLAADMGRSRDVPGSKMMVFRVSGRPLRFVELGLNYLNVQGGEGSPSATWRQRLSDIFLFWDPAGRDVYISDKVIGADVRVTLPAIGLTLYANGLTTDDRGHFQQPANGLWEDAIWLVGAREGGLGADGRLDVWAEWRHSGAEAQAHHQFTSGLTLDDRVIGDALGPHASSVQGGIDWTGPESRISVGGFWERFSGDDMFLGNPGRDPSSPEYASDYTWVTRADNPDEIRKRVTAEWIRFPDHTGLRTTLRLGYEHVTRFNFTDENRSNFLVQLKLDYLW